MFFLQFFLRHLFCHITWNNVIVSFLIILSYCNKYIMYGMLEKKKCFHAAHCWFFGKLCQHFCLEKRAWQAFDSETTPTNFLWEFCANTLFWYVCSFSAILATFLSVFLWRIIDCFDCFFLIKTRSIDFLVVWIFFSFLFFCFFCFSTFQFDEIFSPRLNILAN